MVVHVRFSHNFIPETASQKSRHGLDRSGNILFFQLLHTLQDESLEYADYGLLPKVMIGLC